MSMVFRGGPLSKRRSQRGASEIAQFVPALYILFLIVFLPLINLGGLFVAAAVQYLATNYFVSKASTQPDYDHALETMANEAMMFQSMGLSKFITMVPQGGYVGCGDDLFVISTNVASHTSSTSPADIPLTTPIDTKNNFYELCVESVYSVSPLINLSQVPVIGDVPGVGQPVTLSFTATRPVEHPGGLQANNNLADSSSQPVTPFNRVSTGSPVAATASNLTWRDPTIFEQIKAAGETVVSVSVFTVPANVGPASRSFPNVGWTNTSITLSPGQQMWIDSQAVGTWALGPGYGAVDANGENTTLQTAVVPNMPQGCLVGKFANPNYSGPTYLLNGTAFDVGDTLINYSPANAGTLSMICNDAGGCFADNSGAQMVRVIITQ